MKRITRLLGALAGFTVLAGGTLTKERPRAAFPEVASSPSVRDAEPGPGVKRASSLARPKQKKYFTDDAEITRAATQLVEELVEDEGVWPEAIEHVRKVFKQLSNDDRERLVEHYRRYPSILTPRSIKYLEFLFDTPYDYHSIVDPDLDSFSGEDEEKDKD